MSSARTADRQAQETAQGRFRWINMRIRELYPELEHAESVEFVCECPDEHCFLSVSLPTIEFDVRRAAGVWLIAPGHVEALRPAA
jgi:hypothetical protein